MEALIDAVGENTPENNVFILSFLSFPLLFSPFPSFSLLPPPFLSSYHSFFLCCSPVSLYVSFFLMSLLVSLLVSFRSSFRFAPRLVSLFVLLLISFLVSFLDLLLVSFLIYSLHPFSSSPFSSSSFIVYFSSHLSHNIFCRKRVKRKQ
jgi:hypothetical protein